MKSAQQLLSDINKFQSIDILSSSVCLGIEQKGNRFDYSGPIREIMNFGNIIALPTNQILGYSIYHEKLSVAVYDVDKNQTTNKEFDFKHSENINTLFTPDGKYLLIMDTDTSKFTSIDLNTGEEKIIGSVPYTGRCQTSMTFVDPNILVTIGRDLKNKSTGALLKYYNYNDTWGDYFTLASHYRGAIQLKSFHSYTSGAAFDGRYIYFLGSDVGLRRLDPWNIKADDRGPHEGVFIPNCTGSTILQTLSITATHKAIVIGAHGTDRIEIIRIPPPDAQIPTVIEFKNEIVTGATQLSDKLMMVQTNAGFHICNFLEGKDLGQVKNNQYMAQVLSDKRLVFREGYGLSFADLHQVPAPSDLFDALMVNSSVKEVKLAEIHLSNADVEKLCMLKRTRPDLHIVLPPNITEQVTIRELLNEREKQIETMTLQKNEEDKAMQARLTAIEIAFNAALKEGIQEISTELHTSLEGQREAQKEVMQQTKQQLEDLTRALSESEQQTKNLQEALAEEHKNNLESMKQISRLIRASNAEHSVVAVAPTSVISSLALEVSGTNELSDSLLEKLTHGTTVVDINLIKFSDQIADGIKASLKARGAIFNIQDLVAAVKQMQTNSNKDTLARLIFAVEQLINEYAFLPAHTKKPLHDTIINELLENNLAKLNLYPEIKALYVAKLRDTFTDPTFDPDVTAIRPAERIMALSEIFQSHPELIAVHIKDYLLALKNHLQECSDPQAAQNALLRHEVEILKKELEAIKKGQSKPLLSDHSLFNNKEMALEKKVYPLNQMTKG